MAKRQVIGDGDLFWQPEITGEAIPNLEVLFIRDAIPVNGLNWLFMTRNVVIVLVRHAASLQYLKRTNSGLQHTQFGLPLSHCVEYLTPILIPAALEGKQCQKKGFL